MKLRHVAGVTLVGWCLIVPPVSQPNQTLETNAPFSQWVTIETYDTAAACKNELAKLTAVISGNINLSLVQRRAISAKCLAADDPRLHADNFEVY
jgi:hypothetical protein